MLCQWENREGSGRWKLVNLELGVCCYCNDDNFKFTGQPLTALGRLVVASWDGMRSESDMLQTYGTVGPRRSQNMPEPDKSEDYSAQVLSPSLRKPLQCGLSLLFAMASTACDSHR